MDWAREEGLSFRLPDGDSQLSHKLSTVPALNSTSVASPGQGRQSSFWDPMSPGLVFHPEEGSYILDLLVY